MMTTDTEVGDLGRRLYPDLGAELERRRRDLRGAEELRARITELLAPGPADAARDADLRAEVRDMDECHLPYLRLRVRRLERAVTDPEAFYSRELFSAAEEDYAEMISARMLRACDRRLLRSRRAWSIAT